MKKILGIIGSPRKMGNSEVIIKEICRNISDDHELSLVKLTDFNIEYCRGCYSCLFKKERCVIKDDLYTIVDAIREADAVILAAPTYLLGANASLKRFIDRGLAFCAHVDQMFGTPSVGVCVAGLQHKEGHGLLNVENFLKMIFSEVKSTKVLYGALPGEVIMSEENKAVATELANALFKPVARHGGHRCHICGGDTFRLLGGGMDIKCMLCGNIGTMELNSGEPVVNIDPGDHQMFGGKGNILMHKEWLMGMKAKFIEKKEELKAVNNAYKEEGVRIKPAGKEATGKK